LYETLDIEKGNKKVLTFTGLGRFLKTFLVIIMPQLEVKKLDTRISAMLNKLDSSKFVYLLILVFSFILPQSAQADIYRNVGTGKCMNVPGPDRYGNYLNRQISQYNCISNDPEQTFNSDPERDPYRLLRFGKNKSLCWNTINGTTDGAKPFLYVCTWGDSGQMIDYERSIQRLQMSGKGFCIEADATGGNFSPISLKRCRDNYSLQKWTIIK
jgi:hypothetical protein